jgi:hypothetical protein
VGFDEGEHHVVTFGAQLLRLFKHMVSLADSDTGTNIDLEPPPVSVGETFQDAAELRSSLGIWARFRWFQQTSNSAAVFGSAQ